MRSTLHGPEAFLLNSKKPRIIDLVARCAVMTEDQIRALPEKPDVIRGLLNLRKKGDQARAASMAECLADMMQAAHRKD